MSSLDLFDNLTKKWFESELGSPTPVQEESWPAIAAGGHTLVSAPTGTGKTLSAFLVFIDRLKKQIRERTLKKGLHLIYISPLKALAGDIRENLHRPLNGILREEMQAGVDVRERLDIGIRTGDTSTADRRAMLKNPPHILITTPESLYLLITSQSGRDMLKTAKAIIIDELHALIDTKRGAHLMLTMARLDMLCGRPLQRIGLSATIEPLEVAAEYLSCAGPDEPVTIAAPKMKKDYDIEVNSPVENMRLLPEGTIWPELARAVYDHCFGARSVIAFVDGRMYAEKLAFYVNMLGGEGFARTHHGCVSKEQRFQAETDLRSGKLRLLCATSSMELGIDVGEIDRVVQIAYPQTISSVMQRLGRAGHNPGRVSVMHMFPRTAPEGLHCGLTAKTAMDGGIERSKPPHMCFDVLAQHLVSMACGEGYSIDDAMRLLPRAYPFRDVTRDDVKSVLSMLAGDYEHKRDLPVRPRILYDRINEKVEGDAYSRMLAISTGGTIPDTGMFAVRAENGAKLGELDEEFVFEARVGDKFLLGSFAWKITAMNRDTVTVVQSSTEGAQPPFWRLFWMGRKLQTGIAFGRHMRRINEAGYDEEAIAEVLSDFGLDEYAVDNTLGFLLRQLDATSGFPDDRTIIAEHFTDETGEYQIMFHSIFGKQVNAPLAVLLQETARNMLQTDVTCFQDDDGILLMGNDKKTLPEGILQSILPNSARPILEASLPATPLFSITFRHNAARALMMGVRKAQRQPLWLQRLRSTEMLDGIVRAENHPLIRETKRECLEDYWNLPGLINILESIQNGGIQVKEVFLTEPSPMSLPLRRQIEASLMYEYTSTTTNINAAAQEAIDEMQKIKPGSEQLARFSERKKLPEDEKQLHALLMIEGDLVAGELPVSIEWLESLCSQGRALYTEPGLWIAAEHAEEYAAAFGTDLDSVSEEERFREQKNIARRLLRYKGAKYPEQIAERYCWTEDYTNKVLADLKIDRRIVEDGGLYYHGDIYERARNDTILTRRRQIKTQPAENYAAFLVGRINSVIAPEDQLENALKSLTCQAFTASVWENILLPARVTNYRQNMLETKINGGAFFWKIDADRLVFNHYDEIDWDADMTQSLETLDGDEKIIFQTLLARGASFATAFSGPLNGRPVYETLHSMLEKGLIQADSFTPVRQWLNKAKTEKIESAKQRVNARVSSITSGRWQIVYPQKIFSAEQSIEYIFDRLLIVCKETVQAFGLSWGSALELLRILEYTGRARRGYFIEGLSGAQFIRSKDFQNAVYLLENPPEDLLWLPAIDPMQPWGKYFAYPVYVNFTSVPGTAVALKKGRVVALFERQGQTLKVFEETDLDILLESFVKICKRKRIYPSQKKITVKQYPACAEEALTHAGFIKVMMDYVLYL